MSLLGWGVVMFGVWIALNVVVYGTLDRDAPNTHRRSDGSVWLLGEGTLMINGGTPFHAALITIVIMMLLRVAMPALSSLLIWRANPEVDVHELGSSRRTASNEKPQPDRAGLRLVF
jgi:hypothetical protein